VDFDETRAAVVDGESRSAPKTNFMLNINQTRGRLISFAKMLAAALIESAANGFALSSRRARQLREKSGFTITYAHRRVSKHSLTTIAHSHFVGSLKSDVDQGQIQPSSRHSTRYR